MPSVAEDELFFFFRTVGGRYPGHERIMATFELLRFLLSSIG